MPLIKTKNLTKKYKEITAVHNTSVSIDKGTVYGLIGKNGAGKTTFLRLLAGLSVPTEGTVEYSGNPTVASIIESPGIFPALSARDNLIVKAKNIGKEANADVILKTVGLTQAADRRASQFSLGMKQRLGIAIALVGNPDILLLDEPMNGLDPEGMREMREMIESLAEQGKTIIISSHLLDELSKTATRFGFMKDGRILREFSREEIEGKTVERYRLKTDDTKKTIELLQTLQAPYEQEEDVILLPMAGKAANRVLSEVLQNDMTVLEFRKDVHTLEDIFAEESQKKGGMGAE